MTSLVVQVGGRNLQWVQSFSLRLSVTEPADEVQVVVADDIGLADLDIGDSMAVAIEGRIVLVGEVLNIRNSVDANSKTTSITGFSSAQRLTKSTIKIGDGESVTSRVLRDLSLRQIVERVVKPFDIVVDVGETAAKIADTRQDQDQQKRGGLGLSPACGQAARVHHRQWCGIGYARASSQGFRQDHAQRRKDLADPDHATQPTRALVGLRAGRSRGALGDHRLAQVQETQDRRRARCPWRSGL